MFIPPESVEDKEDDKPSNKITPNQLAALFAAAAMPKKDPTTNNPIAYLKTHVLPLILHNDLDAARAALDLYKREYRILPFDNKFLFDAATPEMKELLSLYKGKHPLDSAPATFSEGGEGGLLRVVTEEVPVTRELLEARRKEQEALNEIFGGP